MIKCFCGKTHASKQAQAAAHKPKLIRTRPEQKRRAKPDSSKSPAVLLKQVNLSSQRQAPPKKEPQVTKVVKDSGTSELVTKKKVTSEDPVVLESAVVEEEVEVVEETSPAPVEPDTVRIKYRGNEYDAHLKNGSYYITLKSGQERRLSENQITLI